MLLLLQLCLLLYLPALKFHFLQLMLQWLLRARIKRTIIVTTNAIKVIALFEFITFFIFLSCVICLFSFIGASSFFSYVSFIFLFLFLFCSCFSILFLQIKNLVFILNYYPKISYFIWYFSKICNFQRSCFAIIKYTYHSHFEFYRVTKFLSMIFIVFLVVNCNRLLFRLVIFIYAREEFYIFLSELFRGDH